MIGDLVTWWSEQMLQWVPARLVARDRGAAHALVVSQDDAPDGLVTPGHVVPPRVTALLLRRRRDRALGSFAVDPVGLLALRDALPGRSRPPTIVLRLQSALLLEREVVLPLAAEREPERVLGYEMDRLTPFSADEIFWTHDIARRDRARGRVHLRLSVVTRASVRPVLDAMGQAGLAPTELAVEAPDGTPRRIALRRPDSRRARLTRGATAVAAAGCAVLAAAAVALPFLLQSAASRRVEQRIAALRPAVAEAEALRRRVAATTEGVDVVAAERTRLGDALAVLAAVTDLLPDDTFLTDLTLRQGRLTLNGQSDAAVRLIAALSADPVIRDPEFVAPVTRVDGRADLFAIRAEVAR
jgi:general secretion pathway protein L